jgi:hypothetical protein
MKSIDKRAGGSQLLTRTILLAATVLTTGCFIGSILVRHEFTTNAAAIGPSRESQPRTLPVATLSKESLGLKTTTATLETSHSRWEVFTINDKVGFSVTSKLSTPIVVRLDQLLIASNFAPELKPLVLARESKHRRVQNPADLTLEKPRPERIEPGTTQGITIDPDYTTLFPNKTLFNVKHAFASATILDAGIGNSISLEMPVEAASSNERIRIELKLTNSSARLINF